MRSAARWFGVCLCLSSATAQQFVISTYAGGAPPLPLPVPGTSVSVGAPISVAADEKGNVYFASPDLNSIFKLDRSGIVTRVAGSSKTGYSGDGGPATDAKMNIVFGNASAPSAGLAVDRSGNLFIADTSNHAIRRVSPAGIITTVAGTGVAGFSGDDGPAVGAQLAYPWGVAVDPAGNLFIMDAFNYRVRKVAVSGIITTLAVVNGWGLAVDGESNVFVVSLGSAITRISSDGTVSTVPGTGMIFPPAGPLGAGGWSVAVDSHGTLFVADGYAGVYSVSSAGTVTAVAGTNSVGYSGDGGPAINAQFSNPSGVAVDRDGNLLIADRINGRIRMVSPVGVVTTVAGNGTGRFLVDCSSSRYAVPPGDPGPANSAQLQYPLGVAVDHDGSLLIADAGDDRIRKVSASGAIATVAGTGSCGFSGDGGPAAAAQLNGPAAVAVDGNGNFWIVDFGNGRIRKVSSGGIISTVAGDGTPGFSGDGGPANQARLNLGWPVGVAVDSRGNVFFPDAGNNRVRRISADGIITTVAGDGSYGFARDGGQATSTSVSNPRGVAVDSADNLFIAEDGRIRKVSRDGTIITVAGGLTSSQLASSGDGGPADSARFGWPVGVAADSGGNLLIADPGVNFEGGDFDDPQVDERIRWVSADGIITTIAGTGVTDFSGDGGPATRATFNGSIGVAVDGAGNVYVADALNGVVRILRPANTSVLIGAVVDAASQHADPLSPGKIVVIYGDGLGPPQLIRNQPNDGQFGTGVGGTTVSFNGIAAPILYSSSTQVAAVVPYAVSGSTARVSVSYQKQVSADYMVPLAIAAPSIFTANQGGWGQTAAINIVDGTVNTPANPVKIGGSISLYATGEGQTAPSGVDGKVGGSMAPGPVLPVTVMIDGIPAVVEYAGGEPGQIAGLMQVNVRIPVGVRPGGYVPVVLRVGDASAKQDAVWIAVSAN